MKTYKKSNIYVGRTDAFYNDDDENWYVPEYWAWSLNEDDSDFSDEGEIHQLTAEGAELLKMFLEYRNMNAYQRQRAGRDYRKVDLSWNQMWSLLEDDGHFVIDNIPADMIQMTIAIPMDDVWETIDDIDEHKKFDNNRLETAYMNACDCHYYGEGKSAWLREGLTPEEETLVWDEAFDTVSEGYRY